LALVKAHEAQDLKNDRLNLFFAEIWDGRWSDDKKYDMDYIYTLKLD
jgi:hypothetical protein